MQVTIPRKMKPKLIGTEAIGQALSSLPPDLPSLSALLCAEHPPRLRTEQTRRCFPPPYRTHIPVWGETII